MRVDARLVTPAAPEWADALLRARHDIYHLPEYVSLDARRSGGTALAFWYSEDSRVLLLPVVLRRVPNSDLVDVASPYGYPGPVSDVDGADTGFWRRACRAMVDVLHARGVVTAFVRLHPLLPVPLDALAGVGQVIRHGETVSVDLQQSVEEMWRKTRRGHRREIAKSRGPDVRIVMDDWSRLRESVLVYHESMRRLEATVEYFFPFEYFAVLHDALGDHMHLVVAIRDGHVIGVNIFFEHAGIVQGHVLASARQGSPRCWPDKLLVDEVRRWTKSRGNIIYHLGGGVGGANDNLFWYKSGFSDLVQPFHTWRIVVDADAYRSLIRGDLPISNLSGYFPPYRA